MGVWSTCPEGAITVPQRDPTERFLKGLGLYSYRLASELLGLRPDTLRRICQIPDAPKPSERMARFDEPGSPVMSLFTPDDIHALRLWMESREMRRKSTMNKRKLTAARSVRRVYGEPFYRAVESNPYVDVSGERVATGGLTAPEVMKRFKESRAA